MISLCWAILGYSGFCNESCAQPMSGLRRKTRTQFGLVHYHLIDPQISMIVVHRKTYTRFGRVSQALTWVEYVCLAAFNYK